METVFESESEKRVAGFLDNLNIKWEAQPKVLVTDNYGKERTTYPDFHLPEFGIYLEVCGAERTDYYNNKKKLYEKNRIPMIFIHTYKEEQKWKLYLISQTLQIQNKRQSKLLTSLVDNFFKD
ncbi:hypothetical protein MBGDF03_00848 [Thermoplasmatales archaeon SCGC AB-540-F20]|nr:hypothetical protein MBGDF03_00848 [Thermoplasmatales archaeon SCGC AB-540-F20]